MAAAGNNARRAGGVLGFVGMPANSPSIMAVAAVALPGVAAVEPQTGSQIAPPDADVQ